MHLLATRMLGLEGNDVRNSRPPPCTSWPLSTSRGPHQVSGTHPRPSHVFSECRWRTSVARRPTPAPVRMHAGCTGTLGSIRLLGNESSVLPERSNQPSSIVTAAWRFWTPVA
ncbi:hypothetical protein O3P69_003749 [Scylla paramamosain]